MRRERKDIEDSGEGGEVCFKNRGLTPKCVHSLRGNCFRRVSEQLKNSFWWK